MTARSLESGRQRPGRHSAKFTDGSVMRHILVMTGTSAIGLMAIFAGDLANLFYLSRLDDVAIVAAVGYASSILFLTISVGIGLSIAAISLVSPAIGAGNLRRARRLSINAHLTTAAVSTLLAIILWAFIPWLLDLLGAAGRAKALATTYLQIVVPFMPMIALGICSAAILRSLGDASRAMHVTLSGAITTILLDPIFIFSLGLDFTGAAIVAAISRCVIMLVGFWGVFKVHRFTARIRLQPFLNDLPGFARVAIPAILTSTATPFANAWVTSAISPFGDAAVAGWTLIGRLLPVVFGTVYSLSGAIGPIIGQNLGAGNFSRVRETVMEALKFVVFFTAGAWIIMALSAHWIVSVFRTTGEAADLVIFFCRWLVPLFAFLGALFVANAAFNTLGRPQFSTAFNWGRATLGTIPFVYAGAAMAGAQGVVVANFLGAIIFGSAAVLTSFWLIDKLAREDADLAEPASPAAKASGSATDPM